MEVCLLLLSIFLRLANGQVNEVPIQYSLDTFD